MKKLINKQPILLGQISNIRHYEIYTNNSIKCIFRSRLAKFIMDACEETPKPVDVVDQRIDGAVYKVDELRRHTRSCTL